MHLGTIAWIVIAIIGVFVMARGCGGMVGGMRGGGCGMPRRRPESSRGDQSEVDKSKPGKAA